MLLAEVAVPPFHKLAWGRIVEPGRAPHEHSSTHQLAHGHRLTCFHSLARVFKLSWLSSHGLDRWRAWRIEVASSRGIEIPLTTGM